MAARLSQPGMAFCLVFARFIHPHFQPLPRLFFSHLSPPAPHAGQRTVRVRGGVFYSLLGVSKDERVGSPVVVSKLWDDPRLEKCREEAA